MISPSGSNNNSVVGSIAQAYNAGFHEGQREIQKRLDYISEIYRSTLAITDVSMERLARILEEEVQPYLPPTPDATYADGMNFMALNCARIVREYAARVAFKRNIHKNELETIVKEIIG